MRHDEHIATPTRRQLLGSAAAAAAATVAIVPRSVLGGPKHTPPSDKVNVALVGAGGRGLQNARDLMQLDDVQITAIADPAEHWDLNRYYYKGVAGRKPVREEIVRHYDGKQPNHSCAEYEDFRVMLEREKAIDAVLCATPDHLHAAVTLAALRAGKHVYCEKPLTHNIAESRLVARVARETGLATQMGNQGHSNEGIRLTCEWIRAGAIGPVREVHAWVPASRWNPALQGRPAEPESPPRGLHWDLWLGPRDPVPFHSAYAPVAWRDFWMFGCGAMGDFGCHDLDAACWALDLDMPQSVEMHAAGYMDAEIAPHGETGYFQFGPRGNRPAVKITWYSGGLKPPRPDALADGRNLPSRGVLFVGDAGMMLCGGAGGQPQLLPESLDASFVRPEPTIRRSGGHHRDWIDAIKGGPPASSEFQYGARLNEITLLGLLALRTREIIHWDADGMTTPGVAAAEAIVHGSYRKGWEL